MRDVVTRPLLVGALLLTVACSDLGVTPPTTGMVTVEVAAAGNPVQGAVVVFGNLQPDTTDASGRVRYDAVVPGDHSISLTRLPVDFTLGPAPNVKTLSIEAGETQAVEWSVELATPAAVVGALNISFSPRTATIQAGESVRFEYRSGSPHTVTPETEFGHWVDRPLASPDDDFTVTFNTPGIYRYLCEPHATGFGEDEGPMNGVVIVK